MESLLERLQVLVPGASRRTLKQMLEHGRIQVNGKEVRRGSEPLPEKAKVIILPKAATIAEPPVPILLEDDHLIVAVKPAGMLSVSTREAARESLWSSLRKMLRVRGKGEKIHLVHRLDEAASGILVFAKSEMAKKTLKALFEKHGVDRRYAALVEGRMVAQKGTFKSRLVEMDEPRHRVRSVADRDPVSVQAKARLATTNYTVLSYAKGLTAVEVRTESGRKHQIRVHFAEAGHPVAGDTLYGAARGPRLFLHAWVLGFAHPVTRAPLRFVAKPGREFSERFRDVFERVRD